MSSTLIGFDPWRIFMETELTRKMKMGLAGFKLEMPTQMRTPRYAEEVSTPTGIVDFIRFEDYKKEQETWCLLEQFNSLTKNDQVAYKSMFPNITPGQCKKQGLDYPNENCPGCVFKKHSYVVGIMVTCYECKITVSDFHSPNGHNFHGNKNYYVVPKEIYKQIEKDVPNDIGIIVYYKDSGSYRIMRECKWKDINDELKTLLLYNAFKKWVDKCHCEYFKQKNKGR